MNSKDYKKVITILGKITTISTIHNNLNSVFVKTEDQKLKKLLNELLKELVNYESVLEKKKLASNKHHLDLTKEPFKSLISYCEDCIESEKPQWQIIAEQHGWSKK